MRFSVMQYKDVGQFLLQYLWRCLQHQVPRHVSVDTVTVLVTALVHNVVCIVVLARAIVVVHVPPCWTDEHVAAYGVSLWHEAELRSVCRTWIEPLPSIPAIEGAMITGFSDHCPNNVLFQSVAAHETIIKVNTSARSIVANVVGNCVVRRS